MSAKTVHHVLSKTFGRMSFVKLGSLGLIHVGHACEELEIMLRGGRRHECVNECGSDIIMPDGSLVEVKSSIAKARLRKSKDVLREVTSFSLSRLNHKEGSRLVAYIFDSNFGELVRFEFDVGGWEDMVCESSASGAIGVTVKTGYKVSELNETNCRSAFFDSSRYYVKPLIIG